MHRNRVAHLCAELQGVRKPGERPRRTRKHGPTATTHVSNDTQKERPSSTGCVRAGCARAPKHQRHFAHGEYTHALRQPERQERSGTVRRTRTAAEWQGCGGWHGPARRRERQGRGGEHDRGWSRTELGWAGLGHVQGPWGRLSRLRAARRLLIQYLLRPEIKNCSLLLPTYI